MELRAPFQITPRLLPGLRVDKTWISLDIEGVCGGRVVYRWYIDMPNQAEFSKADLKSGVGGAGYQEMFGSLLAFLTAAAESLYWEERTGQKGECTDLFPRPVVKWARKHQDELETLREKIETNHQLIIGA